MNVANESNFVFSIREILKFWNFYMERKKTLLIAFVISVVSGFVFIKVFKGPIPKYEGLAIFEVGKDLKLNKIIDTLADLKVVIEHTFPVTANFAHNTNFLMEYRYQGNNKEKITKMLQDVIDYSLKRNKKKVRDINETFPSQQIGKIKVALYDDGSFPGQLRKFIIVSSISFIICLFLMILPRTLKTIKSQI